MQNKSRIDKPFETGSTNADQKSIKSRMLYRTLAESVSFLFGILAIVWIVTTLLNNYEDQKSADRLQIDNQDKLVQLLQMQDSNVRARIENFRLLLDTIVNQPSDQISLNYKIQNIERRIDSQQIATTALRQAIQPEQPEEVLTIIRLKDQLQLLKSEYLLKQEENDNRQKLFEESIRNEIKSADDSRNLILIVLIPLILQFLYSIWKDYKRPASIEINKSND